MARQGWRHEVATELGVVEGASPAHQRQHHGAAQQQRDQREFQQRELQQSSAPGPSRNSNTAPSRNSNSQAFPPSPPLHLKLQLKFQHYLQLLLPWLLTVLLGIIVAMNGVYIALNGEFLGDVRFGMCAHNWLADRKRCCGGIENFNQKTDKCIFPRQIWSDNGEDVSERDWMLYGSKAGNASLITKPDVVDCDKPGNADQPGCGKTPNGSQNSGSAGSSDNIGTVKADASNSSTSNSNSETSKTSAAIAAIGDDMREKAGNLSGAESPTGTASSPLSNPTGNADVGNADVGGENVLAAAGADSADGNADGSVDGEQVSMKRTPLGEIEVSRSADGEQVSMKGRHLRGKTVSTKGDQVSYTVSD
jgi:hypothetical protein